MKRIIMCLSIAVLSFTAMNAQETTLKEYEQRQAQELKETIRTQTMQNEQEAAKRMQTKKREIQNEIDARRSELMQRPDGMLRLSN